MTATVAILISSGATVPWFNVIWGNWKRLISGDFSKGLSCHFWKLGFWWGLWRGLPVFQRFWFVIALKVNLSKDWSGWLPGASTLFKCPLNLSGVFRFGSRSFGLVVSLAKPIVAPWAFENLLLWVVAVTSDTFSTFTNSAFWLLSHLRPLGVQLLQFGFNFCDLFFRFSESFSSRAMLT
jgi:hypothetical protein